MYAAIDDEEWAKKEVSTLLRYFVGGMNEPLAYFPKTALAGLNAQVSKGKVTPSKEDIYKKMAAEFNGTQQISGEGSDSYISRLWPKWNEELAQKNLHYADEILKKAVENAADGRKLAANK